MGDSEHFKSDEFIGVFYKTEDYPKTCKGCGRGYHGNRYDAHHILPAVSFANLDDDFADRCLKLTDFNINKKYALGGLPKLTAFILFFQDDEKMPFEKALEQHVTMKRWSTVRQYLKDAHKVIKFPGNYPAHNPVNWGHTQYNKEVTEQMTDQIFDLLKDGKPHPKPKSVEGQLKTAVKTHWRRLQAIANGPGGGGHVGIKANLKNRYGSAKNGW
jgi:hypothetical protein